MIEHVLTVACTVAESAEQLNKLGVNIVNACFKNGSFALVLDCGVNLTSCLFNCFFNSRRMNTSVGNKSFKCNSGNLTSYRFKARKRVPRAYRR